MTDCLTKSFSNCIVNYLTFVLRGCRSVVMQSAHRVGELCDDRTEKLAFLVQCWESCVFFSLSLPLSRAEHEPNCGVTVKPSNELVHVRESGLGLKAQNQTTKKERNLKEFPNHLRQSVENEAHQGGRNRFKSGLVFRNGKSLTLIFQSASPHRRSFDHRSPPRRRLDTRTLTVFPQNVSSDSNWVSAHRHTHTLAFCPGRRAPCWHGDARNAGSRS